MYGLLVSGLNFLGQAETSTFEDVATDLKDMATGAIDIILPILGTIITAMMGLVLVFVVYKWIRRAISK